MTVRIGVQDALVAALAAVALGWLVWRRLRRRGAAAACEDCPAATGPREGGDFVPLADLSPPARRPDRPR